MTSANQSAASVLREEDLEKFKHYASKISFNKDAIIFAEGDEPAYLYFIETGMLAVSIQKFTVQETVALLREGDCVGEMSFFNGEKRAATVTAKTDATLLAVSRETFMELLSKDEDLELRVRNIIDARTRDLARKEAVIDDHTAGKTVNFQMGIKGDPSLRESAFMRKRYESVVDGILPLLQLSLYDLLVNRCVYEILIHFNSGEVLVKSVFNPFIDDIHPATKLTSKAYINRHFPRVDYDKKIDAIRRMMNHISKDSCMSTLDTITRNKMEMFYKSWKPLTPKEIAQTVSRLLSLRNIPDFYLRNFTISMIRDSIRLQFNCDGTHLLDGKSYQEFLKNNLIEGYEAFEIDRRKSNRRNPSGDRAAKLPFQDRRNPPGRRQEDWDTLYDSLSV